MALMMRPAILAAALLTAAAAQEKLPDQPTAIETVKLGRPSDFNVDVLPVLRANCLACHNTKDKKGDLVLETPAGLLKGGESGPAIVPGKADQSLLLAVASLRKEPPMPPAKNKSGAKRLTPRELGLVKLWIDEGAKDSAPKPLDPPLFRPGPEGWNPIYSVALDAEGRYAACGRAGRLFIYDVPTGRLVARPSDPKLAALAPDLAHRDAVQAIAVSPDGSLLATGGYREIKLWQRKEEAKTSKVDLGGESRVAALSADGKWIAVAGAGIRIIEIDGGRTTKLEAKDVAALEFSPDGSTLLAVSGDEISGWTLPDGKPLETRVSSKPAPTAIDWFGDGKQYATGSADGLIRIWNADFKEVAKAAREVKHGAPVVALAVSPDGKSVVVAGGGPGAKLYAGDGAKGTEIRTDGPERRRDAEAQALVAFMDKEVKYREAQLKAAEDAKTKEEAEAKKAADALPPAEKAFKEKQDALAKAKAEREGAEKLLPDAKKAADDAAAALKKLAETEAVTKATTAKGAADKALADAEKAAVAAKKAADKAADPEKESAGKALAEAERARDEAKKKAEAAKAELDQANAAFKKAEADKAAADAKLKEAEKKPADAKKAEDAAAAAVDPVKAAFDSAVRRVERSKETAARIERSIAEEKSKLGEAKTLHERSGADRKRAADALAQAAIAVRSVAWSADGSLVILGTEDGRLHVFTARGEEVGAYGAAGKPPIAAGFAGESTLLSVASDGAVRAGGLVPSWTLARTIEPADPAQPPVDRVMALAFSPDGKRLAGSGGVPSREGELAIWTVADGRLERRISDAHSDQVFDVSFSPDGTLLASCAADKFAKIFDVESGKLVRAFEGHTHHVLGVAWNRNGRTLATAGADNLVMVWDRTTGQRVKSVQGFDKQATSLRYLGFEDRVAVTSGGAPLRLVTEAGNVKALEGAGPFTYSVAVSGDGRLLAAGGLDGTLRLWKSDATQPFASLAPPK
jgi:WD40 repeat protein